VLSRKISASTVLLSYSALHHAGLVSYTHTDAEITKVGLLAMSLRVTNLQLPCRIIHPNTVSLGSGRVRCVGMPYSYLPPSSLPLCVDNRCERGLTITSVNGQLFCSRPALPSVRSPKAWIFSLGSTIYWTDESIVARCPGGRSLSTKPAHGLPRRRLRLLSGQAFLHKFRASARVFLCLTSRRGASPLKLKLRTSGF